MNTAKHVALSFSDRCAIAAACLPKADYRTQLEKLHAEMLAALAAERERCAILCETTASQHYASARIAADYLPVQFRAAAEALTNAAAAIRGG